MPGWRYNRKSLHPCTKPLTQCRNLEILSEWPQFSVGRSSSALATKITKDSYTGASVAQRCKELGIYRYSRSGHTRRPRRGYRHDRFGSVGREERASRGYSARGMAGYMFWRHREDPLIGPRRLSDAYDDSRHATGYQLDASTRNSSQNGL